ncbi:hypothetical protein [Spirosoma soli]|uniref:hypothetical protein n=1 Tax=Spirosoma soli TaxID=1770529 RepID=UPI0036D2AF28
MSIFDYNKFRWRGFWRQVARPEGKFAAQLTECVKAADTRIFQVAYGAISTQSRWVMSNKLKGVFAGFSRHKTRFEQ